ncbi:MAG: hypothetical protein V9G19_20765 [Tetrasphaera sp.]
MDDDRLLGILGSNGAGKTTPIHVLVCADFPYPVPLPLTAADRDGGYWWPLSMRQVETCRTIVFDAPSPCPHPRRVGQGCVLASPAFERVAPSILTEDGRRSPALRFGDLRVMALLGALCVCLTVLGFTNRSLRARVSHLLGVDYTVNQMSYDLTRLRINGLIDRVTDATHHARLANAV